MTRTIKLDDPTYYRLQVLQRPRETYSQIVSRLINLWDDTVGLLSRVAPIRPDPTPQGEVNKDALPKVSR